MYYPINPSLNIRWKVSQFCSIMKMVLPITLAMFLLYPQIFQLCYVIRITRSFFFFYYKIKWNMWKIVQRNVNHLEEHEIADLSITDLLEHYSVDYTNILLLGLSYNEKFIRQTLNIIQPISILQTSSTYICLYFLPQQSTNNNPYQV